MTNRRKCIYTILTVILLVLAVCLISRKQGTLGEIYENDFVQGYEYISLRERDPNQAMRIITDEFVPVKDAGALREYLLSLRLKEKYWQSSYTSREECLVEFSKPGATFRIDVLDSTTIIVVSNEPPAGSIVKGARKIAYTVEGGIDLEIIRGYFPVSQSSGALSSEVKNTITEKNLFIPFSSVEEMLDVFDTSRNPNESVATGFDKSELTAMQSVVDKIVSDNNVFVPRYYGTALPLRNQPNMDNILIETSSVYDMPLIWYYSELNGANVIITVGVLPKEQLENIGDGGIEALKTLHKDLLASRPANPNASQVDITVFNEEISVSGVKLPAVITQYSNDPRYHVEFIFDEVLYVKAFISPESFNRGLLEPLTFESVLIQNQNSNFAGAIDIPTSSVQEVKTVSEVYDFDHDGDPETLEVVRHFDSILQDTWFELRVKRADGTLLWSDKAHTSHTGYNSLFACTLDGKDYLLQYNPTMYQGNCNYTYRLFALGSQGNMLTVREAAVSFDINWRSTFHSKFKAEEIADFMDEVNGLLANGKLLLNTDTSLENIDPENPRDIPWWLKDSAFCSGYVYDESKTLRDNLLALERIVGD